MKNTFGSDLSLTIFGESHGRAIGAVLVGMAAALSVIHMSEPPRQAAISGGGVWGAK